jgi:hypothetical protein
MAALSSVSLEDDEGQPAAGTPAAILTRQPRNGLLLVSRARPALPHGVSKSGLGQSPVVGYSRCIAEIKAGMSAASHGRSSSADRRPSAGTSSTTPMSAIVPLRRARTNRFCAGVVALSTPPHWSAGAVDGAQSVPLIKCSCSVPVIGPGRGEPRKEESRQGRRSSRSGAEQQRRVKPGGG